MNRKNDTHIKHLIVTVLTACLSRVLLCEMVADSFRCPVFPLYAALHPIMPLCITNNNVVVLRCIKRS